MLAARGEGIETLALRIRSLAIEFAETLGQRARNAGTAGAGSPALLEEGTLSRDQAACHLRQVEHLDTFGASSLSTIVQMVAHGLGVTLLPRLSLDVEARQRGIKLLRYADPAPARTLGLAWRATSPRRHEFLELAELIRAVEANGRRRARASAKPASPQAADNA